jgi:tetratricopeptide (TPR) repeat protein
MGNTRQAEAEFERVMETAVGVSGFYQRAKSRLKYLGGDSISEDCESMASLSLNEPNQLKLRALGMWSICGRPDLARLDYDALVVIAPHWADPYVSRAELNRSQGRLLEAVDDLDRAIELAPSWVTPLIVRGDVHAEMEQFSEALEAYERAASVGGESSDLRYKKANAQLRLGRSEDALRTINTAIEEEPTVEANYRRLGAMLFDLGRVDQAIAAATRSIEIDRANAYGYADRAYYSLHQADGCRKANADLQRARDVNAEFTDEAYIWATEAWAHLAYYAEDCPDLYDEALAGELANKAVDASPDTSYYRMILGFWLYRQDRLDEAQVVLSEAHGLSNHAEPVTLFLEAMTSWRLGCTAEASSFYRQALARMSATFSNDPRDLHMKEQAARLLGISS